MDLLINGYVKTINIDTELYIPKDIIAIMNKMYLKQVIRLFQFAKLENDVSASRQYQNDVGVIINDSNSV